MIKLLTLFRTQTESGWQEMLHFFVVLWNFQTWSLKGSRIPYQIDFDLLDAVKV